MVPLQPPPSNQNLNPKQEHSQTGILKIILGKQQSLQAACMGCGITFPGFKVQLYHFELRVVYTEL